MEDNLKNFYAFKKIKLEDGEYLDIGITLPIPEIPITKSKETDSKYIKCFLGESLSMSKAYENKKDVDFRMSSFINFTNLAKLFYPTFLYSLVIIYKRFTRNKIKPENTRQENLIPRLKGVGAAFLIFVSINILYGSVSRTLTEGRLEYLKELLGDDRELNMEDYEKYKSLYFEEVNKKEKQINNQGYRI
jgi:hypothetical protein